MTVRDYSFATISYEHLVRTVKKARLIKESLYDKYPELKAQLVFCFRGCQAHLTTDIKMILKHLPEMVCNEELKHTLHLYYRDLALITIQTTQPTKIARLNRNIGILEKQLWFKGIARIDLNISRRSTGLIPQLLCDPMVDESRSYFHKPGFARVSLGTLAALSGMTPA